MTPEADDERPAATGGQAKTSSVQMMSASVMSSTSPCSARAGSARCDAGSACRPWARRAVATGGTLPGRGAASAGASERPRSRVGTSDAPCPRSIAQSASCSHRRSARLACSSCAEAGALARVKWISRWSYDRVRKANGRARGPARRGRGDRANRLGRVGGSTRCTRTSGRCGGNGSAAVVSRGGRYRRARNDEQWGRITPAAWLSLPSRPAGSGRNQFRARW